ncbi:aspartyl protease [Pontibacter ummariensis]|uniref:Aspartyl protease n=1 Tax=Pontibacter ummariensis TaxID=1610492 RepID=A0A239BWF8_9BACT|nr:PDZ domain-containing protein [Pontibacter ummariensis]PRY15602.1 aspartyl protease [Pontibacter ummariensis]SNS11768.1 Aspartyl protease [Pontibacter ummariensis]
MTKTGFLKLLCLFLFSLPVVVQAQEQLSFEKDTLFFTSNRKKVHLPFKLVHNLIVIPVRVNDSNPLNFILDTGVKTPLITRLYYSDSLSLVETNKVTIRGLGKGHTIEALYSVGNKILMPGVKGEQQEVLVLLEDVFNLSVRMGMPLHGIIGYDIFKNFVVKINYSKELITLYRPDIYLKKKRKAEEYPLHIEDSKPYIFAKIRQHTGDTLDVKLVIDTGASNSLSLYLPSDNRLSLPPKVVEAYLGRGLGGDIHGKIGRLQAFQLGKYELESIPASYPNEEAIQLALNVSDRNGNIGSDILRRFTVVLDYPHQRMLLQPNRKLREPFHYNMTGFEISTPFPGTNYYVVTNVVEGSPAKMVGLQPGDELLFINGQDCSELKLPQLLNLMDRDAGKKLRLRLKRETEILDVDLVLESRI